MKRDWEWEQTDIYKWQDTVNRNRELAQTDIFQKTLVENLDSLTDKVVSSEIAEGNDCKYLNSIEVKMLELKLKELQLHVSSIEEERKSAIKRDKLNIICEKMNQARLNLYLLISMPGDVTRVDVTADIDKNLEILREVSNVGLDEEVKKAFFNERSVSDSHLNSSDLKIALKNTNIMEVVRTAKKNGWDVNIVDGEITILKDGKKIEDLDNYFVNGDTSSSSSNSSNNDGK